MTSAPLVTWHAWRGSVRVASASFPADLPARDVCDEFVDRHGPDLRVTCGRPVVGMLATLQVGSDRYAYEVTEVSAAGAKITLRGRMVRGPLTAEDPGGKVINAYRGQDGTYRNRGRCLVTLGEADAYRDPCF